MRIRSLIAGFAALVFSTLPSFAADPAEMAVEDSYSWSAAYIGLVGGYFATRINTIGCTGACPVNPAYNSWGLGLQVGGDYQLANNFVIGGYGRVMLAGTNQQVPLFVAGAPLAGGTFTVTPQFAGSVGARFGYAVDRFLPYAVVGYSVARFRAANPVFGVAATNTHHGVHFGAGIETLVTENISIDLRYTHTVFGRQPYTFGPGPGGTTNYSANANAFTFALNYRF